MYKYILLILFILNINLFYCITITSISYNGNNAIISGTDLSSVTGVNIKMNQSGVTVSASVDSFQNSGSTIQFTINNAFAVRGKVSLDPGNVQFDWNPTPVVTSVVGTPINGGTITVIGQFLSSNYETTKSTIIFPKGEVVQEFQSSPLSDKAYFTLPTSVSMKYSGLNISLTLIVRDINQTIQFSFDKPEISNVTNINGGISLNGKNFGYNISMVNLTSTDGLNIVVNNVTDSAITVLYSDNPKLSTAGTRYVQLIINGNSLDKIYTLTIDIQVIDYYQSLDKGYIVTNVPVTKLGQILIQENNVDYNTFTTNVSTGVAFSIPWDASIGNFTVSMNIGSGSKIISAIPITIQPVLDNITYGNPCPVQGCDLIFHGFFLQQTKTSIKNLTFGDLPCSNVYNQGYNELRCTMTNGTGANLPVLLLYNNGVTNTERDKLYFSYMAPTISDVGISSMNVTINGTNFNYPLGIVINKNTTCNNPYVLNFNQIFCTVDNNWFDGAEKVYLNVSVGNQYVADDYVLTSFGIKSVIPLNIIFLISILIFILI